MKKFDLIIVGAGPAGLNASVYASRYGVKNVVIGEIPGGLVTQTTEIGNWLGEQNITGFEFVKKATEHVKSLGAEIVNSSVDQIERISDNSFEVLLSNGEKFLSKTIIIATGSKHRHLGVKGEKELVGKGVSYCATCDGFFYKGKTVGVVGGNDSAVSAAIYLSDIVEKVYLIYRGEKLRAENFWIKSLDGKDNVEVVYSTNIVEIIGEDKLEKVVLDNKHNRSNELRLDGLFIEIGFVPNTELLKSLDVDFDEDNHIKVREDGGTSARGIWAAGDITTGSNKFKQIVTAAAEGAICAKSVQEYLRK